MKKRVVFITLLLTAFPLFFIPQTTLAEPMDEDRLQDKTKEVAKTLRCAVCQSESIWESNATLAIQMRDIIRERLIAGESPDEIRAYFISRYGDYIVFKPRFRGLNLLLWVGPFVLLLIGSALLYRNLRKWSTQPEPAESGKLEPINEDQRRRIEDELNSIK